MAWSDVMFSPIRIARDLPIAAKLAMTVVGALSLLTGVSMFALDRLDFVAGTQENALAQLAVQHQVETGLLAAQDLRADRSNRSRPLCWTSRPVTISRCWTIHSQN